MKNTIENMKLTLAHANYELEKRNSKEAKALMNTYRTLYGKILDLSYENFNALKEDTDLLPELKSHIEILKVLEEKSSKILTVLIESNNYRDADNVAEVEKRINRAISDLSRLVFKSPTKKIDREISQGIDIAFINPGYDYTEVYLFDLSKGTFKSEIIRKPERIVGGLTRIMNKYKPSQIIFDKRGLGNYVFEQFTQDSRLSGIRVDEKGSVTYFK